MENETTENENQVLEPIVRKFELAIFNENLKDDGQVELKQERLDQPLIVGVKYNKDLIEKINLYKQCGQVAKIVREIDPPSKDKLEEYNNIFFGRKVLKTAQQTSSQTTLNKSSYKETTAQVKSTINKPKYFKIGDIDIKDDNGKIYQKQWMRLSDIESSNFRIINDKNNSIVNLNGKHIEMKKWVLVETSDDETTNLEENLNG